MKMDFIHSVSETIRLENIAGAALGCGSDVSRFAWQPPRLLPHQTAS
jgi:hypothetical protein